MPPTSTERNKVQDDNPLSASISFASSCIVAEVKNYFLDAISHRYFERIHSEESTNKNSNLLAHGELSINRSGKYYAFHPDSEIVNAFPARRPRRTIMEVLQRDMLSYQNSRPKPGLKRARYERDEFGSVADALSPESHGYLYSATYYGPARTKILSCAPCRALEGYYVIWSETQLRIRVYRQLMTSSPSECASHDDGRLSTHSPILPLLLSQIRSQKVTWCRTGVRKARRVGGTRNRLKASKASCSRGLESLPSRMASHTVLTLHSVHFVRGDALHARCGGAFALQSILHPYQPTVLECYPKQMIHFGFICYALWNAANACFEGGEEGLLRSGDASSSTSSLSMDAGKQRLSAKRRQSILFTGGVGDEDLLPMRDSDAVLVLGLGGNVLGRCLDTLLPTTVRLHVVELEPAVLDACVMHHQLPPLQPVAPLAVGRQDEFKATALNLFPAIKPAEQPPSEFFAAEPHPRGSRYRVYLQDTYDFLEPGRSMRGDSSVVDYNIIFLDCYDPDDEKMMHSRDLLERCHQRLRLGGALVINAHLLPKREVLEKQFLGYGFASVQVLRVAGLDQSIIVCLCSPKPIQTQSNVSPTSQHMALLRERGLRLTLRNAWAVGKYINQRQMLCRRDGHHRDEAGSTQFTLNHAWFKSCHMLPRSRSKQKPLNTIKESLGKNTSGATLIDLRKVCIETESCRIWEHST